MRHNLGHSNLWSSDLKKNYFEVSTHFCVDTFHLIDAFQPQIFLALQTHSDVKFDFCFFHIFSEPAPVITTSKSEFWYGSKTEDTTPILNKISTTPSIPKHSITSENISNPGKCNNNIRPRSAFIPRFDHHNSVKNLFSKCSSFDISASTSKKPPIIGHGLVKERAQLFEKVPFIYYVIPCNRGSRGRKMVIFAIWTFSMYLLLILILEIRGFTVTNLTGGFLVGQNLPKNSCTEVKKIEGKLPEFRGSAIWERCLLKVFSLSEI